jgi:hypothetical protein
MKGLRKYLAPFTPDISGAAAVLYALGGIIVISDAGGCTGNVCGFDEPRWFSSKSAIFSAGLRDIDAILGRDDKFIDKIKIAAARLDAAFVAVIGTPVPAVIATDYRALRRMTEARIGLPALAIDTTGMALYDEGQEKAYKALFETFTNGLRGGEDFVCVLGATPLDLPTPGSAAHIKNALERSNGIKAVVCGEEDSLEFIERAGEARKNIVVSPSGLKIARDLKEKLGTPYETFYPLDGFDSRRFREAHGGKRVLIVHQQVLADALRKELEKCGSFERISAASWFRMDEELMREGDARLAEEDDLLRFVETGNFDTVVGDPLFARALRGWRGDFVPLPHFAVSGSLHAAEREEDFWHGLCA